MRVREAEMYRRLLGGVTILAAVMTATLSGNRSTFIPDWTFKGNALTAAEAAATAAARGARAGAAGAGAAPAGAPAAAGAQAAAPAGGRAAGPAGGGFGRGRGTLPSGVELPNLAEPTGYKPNDWN